MVLSTYQPTSRPFWLRLAPQLTHAHPAVKHGVIALGMIQSRIQRSTLDQLLNIQRPEFSGPTLVHLSKGMRLLSSASPDSVSTEVSLACCILFLAVTIWLDRAAAPVIHIDAAQQILGGYLRAVASNPLLRNLVIDNTYMPEYQSLVVNALTFSDGYPRSNSNVPKNFALDFRLEQAGSFTSFNDAFDSLNNVIRCIIRLNAGRNIRRISDKVSAALDMFLRSLQRLRRKHYSANTENADDVVPGTREQAYQQLLMHHRAAIIMFQALGSEDELAFDVHDRDFLYIVTDCERLFLEDAIAMPSSRSNLRTSLGLLPPLFFVATKCRNSVIRNKALNVLHGALRSERNWTSCMATSMARFVIEEEGHSEEPSISRTVSPSKRIRLENVEFSKQDGKMYIQYLKGLGTPTPVLCRASRPFVSYAPIEQDGAPIQMDRKVLRAYGYTGVILFTPPVLCHCVGEEGNGKLVRDP